MTVEAAPAIWFECEKCDHGQYCEDSLSHGWHEDRVVEEDNIMCACCGHDNHVIREL